MGTATKKAHEISYIQASGDPDAIGRQQGVLLRDQILASYNFYQKHLVPISEQRCRDHGNRYLDVICNHLPDAAEEIYGIAAGADIPVWKIAFLNARTEIILRETENLPAECTAMFFPSVGVLGQNWDWFESYLDLMVLVDIETRGKNRLLTLTEPGVLGKIGLNRKGLGVRLNILPGKPEKYAIPVHLLLRQVLESNSLEDAVSRIEALPRDTYSNVLIANDRGEYQNIELVGSLFNTVDYGEMHPVHSNHFLSVENKEADTALYASSVARFERAVALNGVLREPSLHAMKNLLNDQKKVGDFSICLPFSPYLETRIGTVSSVVMDLVDKVLHCSIDPLTRHSYVTHGFR